MATELDGKDSSPPDKKGEKLELKRIDQLISESIKLNVRTKKTPKSMKSKIHHYDMVKSILSEHLSTYMIVGFDLNEEEFFVMRSNSPLETRALTDLIDDSIATLFENGILRSGPSLRREDSPFPEDMDEDDDDDE